MRGSSFSSKIAFRYLFSKRSEAFISILTFISTIGLAIGVAVLVVVMSIMNGFEYELKSKLLGTNAHVTVRTIGGNLFRWKDLISGIEGVEGVKSVSPYTYNQGLLQFEKRSSGVLVRGIQEDSAAGEQLIKKVTSASPVNSIFEVAKTNSDSSENLSKPLLPGVVIGAELARNLILKVGDTVTLLSPQVQSSPFGLMPRFRRFIVTGIYESGLVEYENALVYVDITVAQKFFRKGESISGLEIRVNDLDKAPLVSESITSNALREHGQAYAQPWTETHKSLWEALRLERSAYFAVLVLLVVMASFSIVSTLVMLVLEKRKDIAVLRTLGATRREVSRIFTFSGMLIGFIGTALGLLLGLAINMALMKYGFPLPEKIFPVATLPIKMDPVAFGTTGLLALLICYLATLYPAYRAGSLRPSELLRFE